MIGVVADDSGVARLNVTNPTGDGFQPALRSRRRLAGSRQDSHGDGGKPEVRFPLGLVGQRRVPRVN